MLFCVARLFVAAERNERVTGRVVDLHLACAFRASAGGEDTAAPRAIKPMDGAATCAHIVVGG
jgi:hypothetical protein